MGIKNIIYKKIAKFFIWLLMLGVLASLFYFGGNELYKRYQQKQYSSLHSLVSKEIMRCAELTSVKTRYSDVILIKKTGMLGMAKAYSMVKFSGILRAGIKDISHASFQISDNRTSIVVNIPKSCILGNEIESQEIFDEATNLFVPIATQSIFAEIDKGRANVEKTLINEGILEEANEHAIELFTQIFTAMGFYNVEIHLIDPKENVNPEILNTFDKVKDSFGNNTKIEENKTNSPISAPKNETKSDTKIDETIPAPKLPTF